MADGEEMAGALLRFAAAEDRVQLRAWLEGAKERRANGKFSPSSIAAGAAVEGTTFYIEQRFNSEFGEWIPCKITSRSGSEYIFRTVDGQFSAQRNANTGGVTEVEENAVMYVDEVMDEWPAYHRWPRIDWWELVLSRLEPVAVPVALEFGEEMGPVPVVLGNDVHTGGGEGAAASTPGIHLVSARLSVDSKGCVSVQLSTPTVQLAAADKDMEARTWPTLAPRVRAVVSGSPGVVFAVSDDGETFGFLHDDKERVWESMQRVDFMRQAVPEDVLPMGAVGYVLKGPLAAAEDAIDSERSGWTGAANRAVCAVLRDNVLAFQGQWEAYLNYYPLTCPEGAARSTQNTYGVPPIPYTLWK